LLFIAFISQCLHIKDDWYVKLIQVDLLIIAVIVV